MKKNPRFLITAGPTREFFDPVRFLSNPSSGKMGYAIAEAALSLSRNVTLISGPVSLKSPKQCHFIPVVSAQDMYKATVKEARRADIIIMTAAVSDYRPARFVSQKIKKKSKNLTLKLVPTQDILKELGRRKKRNQILVGFAAETQKLLKNAMKKLEKKNLDFIVANVVGGKRGGFNDDHNSAVLLSKTGATIRFPFQTKTKLAHLILKSITNSRSR